MKIDTIQYKVSKVIIIEQSGGALYGAAKRAILCGLVCICKYSISEWLNIKGKKNIIVKADSSLTAVDDEEWKERYYNNEKNM